MAAASFVAAFRPPAVTAAGKPAIKSAVAAVPNPPPPRLTRRRNYLRRKLLRTLTKPSPETLTPPQTPAEIPEIGAQIFEFDPLPDVPAAAEPDFVAVEEPDAPNLVEVMAKEDSGVTSGTVLRYGLYVVGLLLVQTVVFAFIMGSDDDDGRKNRRRRRRQKKEPGTNGNWSLSANDGSFRGKLEMKNGSLLYVDEAEMEAKIAEIRLMAREAKEREKSNLRAGGSGSNDPEDVSDEEEDEVEDEDEDSRVRSGIEREINGRLTKVSRRLENNPVMDVKFLNKPEQGAMEKGKRNVVNENEEDKRLMFEKKYKFKSSSSSKPVDKPKGFQGKNRSVSGNDAEVSGRFRGGVQDSDVGGSMEKHVVPPSNGRSSRKGVRSTRLAAKRGANEADGWSDLWWAVVMQHGSNDKGDRGFYALTTTRDDPSQDTTSYTVLFENHVDAQNFSHLLEAFFDELEGITTSVVPLPIKELNNAVKSQAKRVIVVRKGQLRLYAGQPLDEVETVLRTFVK